MGFFMKCADVSVVPRMVTGMPRIKIEFESSILIYVTLAPNAVFPTRIHLQNIARPVESDRPITSCMSVRPSIRSQFMNIGS